MSRKVYHKSKSDMRGTQPSFYGVSSCQINSQTCAPQYAPQYAPQCAPQCAPQGTPQCAPQCTPQCTSTNTICTSCTFNPCNPNIMCKYYAPNYCFNYRNVSLWCEYCMSRRMFPEHYPYDPRFQSVTMNACAVYPDSQYIIPKCNVACNIPQPQCNIPQPQCNVPQPQPQYCTYQPT